MGGRVYCLEGNCGNQYIYWEDGGALYDPSLYDDSWLPLNLDQNLECLMVRRNVPFCKILFYNPMLLFQDLVQERNEPEAGRPPVHLHQEDDLLCKLPEQQ